MARRMNTQIISVAFYTKIFTPCAPRNQDSIPYENVRKLPAFDIFRGYRYETLT